MWPYPWTHVGTPSNVGHMDRVAATMPSQAHAGAAQEAPDIGQWEGQDVPLVRPSSCDVKGGIPTYLTSKDVDDLYQLITIRKEGHRVNVCKIPNSFVNSVRQRLTAYLKAECVYVPWVM